MRLDTTIVAVGAFALGTLLTSSLAVTQKTATLAAPKSRTELIALVKTLDEDLAKLNANHRTVFDGYRALAARAEALSISAQKVATLATAGGGQDQLLNATKEMQEMNQSFNLQYLNLKRKMIDENRRFLALSGLMKSKHDTAKNAISNIR